MKKILVVAHPSVLEVNRAIYRELVVHAQLDVRVLVPESWKGDLIRDLKCEPSVESVNFRLVSAPICFSGNGSLYFFRPGWKRKLGNWQPDLVFVDEEPWSLSALQIYLSFRKTPKVFFTKQNLKKKLPLPFPWIQKYIFSKTKFAFSVASEVTEVLRWKGFLPPIVDLPHSYDPALFHLRTEKEKQVLKTKLKIPLDKVVVSYFGRLTSEKGMDDLLTAQKLMLADSKLENCFFLWVGNGPLAEKVSSNLKSYTSEQTRLLPAFAHHEVGEALALSDILILPSRTVKNWKEQFGRILVEAMASGSAIVGSNSGEIPHLIQRTGGGLSFPEKDSEALYQSIKALVMNPETLSKYKTNGHAYVETNLTHEAVAKTLAEQLFKEST